MLSRLCLRHRQARPMEAAKLLFYAARHVRSASRDELAVSLEKAGRLDGRWGFPLVERRLLYSLKTDRMADVSPLNLGRFQHITI